MGLDNNLVTPHGLYLEGGASFRGTGEVLNGNGVLDLSQYSYFEIYMTSNHTLSFTNASGVQSFLLMLSRSDGTTTTWPSSIRWDGGSPPTHEGASFFTFFTKDAGTTWRGQLLASDINIL